MYFERGTTVSPLLSPNHFWELMSTKYGPLIKVTQILNNQDKSDKAKLLRDDFLRMLEPYIIDNGLRLGYLLTVAKK